MRLALDPDSRLPLYAQISDHLRDSILTGNLRPGVRLPAVRTLAASLGVNRGTVESAYAKLMAEGLVASRQGSGFYVLAHAPGEPAAASRSGDWPAWQGRLRYGGYEAMSAYLPEASRQTDWIALGGTGDSMGAARRRNLRLTCVLRQTCPAGGHPSIRRCSSRRSSISARRFCDLANSRSSPGPSAASSSLRVSSRSSLATPSRIGGSSVR